MRTNIDIDDDLMAATVRASGKKTKKAAVEEAMRHYLRARAFTELVEGMRGIEWDDGLGETEPMLAVAEGHASFEPRR